MNVLVLLTRGPLLQFTGFQVPHGEPVFGGRIDHWEDSDLPVADRLRRLTQSPASEPLAPASGERGWGEGVEVRSPETPPHPRPLSPEAGARGAYSGKYVPDVLAVRLPYGGDVLPGPTVATPEVLDRLREILDESPLHLPHLLRLIEGAAQAFPGTPQVLLAETAFFAGLPVREAMYGLNPDLMDSLPLAPPWLSRPVPRGGGGLPRRAAAPKGTKRISSAVIVLHGTAAGGGGHHRPSSGHGDGRRLSSGGHPGADHLWRDRPEHCVDAGPEAQLGTGADQQPSHHPKWPAGPGGAADLVG